MPRTSTRGSGGGGAPGSATWIPLGVTSIAVGGVASGVDLGTSPVPIQDDLRAMHYPYVPPSVTLSSTPGSGVYEFGASLGSITLNATTVRHTNPITSVIFQKNTGSGFTTIQTQPSPIAGGGLEVYVDATSIPAVALTSYRVTVGDGTATTNSNQRDYTRVYPYYYGSGAPGLTGAQIGSLTKAIVIQGSYTRAFTPTAQVYYYAFPAAYTDLISIIDQNGFNVTPDFTPLRLVTITGLDGLPVSYKVYEFHNITSLGQNITFNR
jgi:hypothetical protein